MKYFAMIDGEQRGPFTLEELGAAGVRPDTYVWCKGMADWQQASEVADICRYYRQRLSQLMHPQAEMPAEPESAKPDNMMRFAGGIEAEPLDPDQNPLTTIPHDTESRPPSRIALAVISIICFPTGVIATSLAVESQKEWKKGNKEKSHDLDRAARMWTGISISLGLVMWAFIFRFFI